MVSPRELLCAGIGSAQIDGAQPGIVRSVNVCLGIVPYHHGMFGRCACLAESLIKESGTGLVGPGILAQDDMVKVIEEVAGTQLAVLHLVKPIAANAHPVAPLRQVIHQAVRPFHYPRLHRTQGQEVGTHLEAEFSRRVKPLTQSQRAAEALHYEVIAVNLTMRILRPQFTVGLPVRHCESLHTGKVPLEMEVVEEFAQGDDGIAMCIIECIIEVDEEMGHIFHKCADVWRRQAGKVRGIPHAHARIIYNV